MMKTLLLVLTERDTWATKVAGSPALFWALESIKGLASETWVHIVYHRTPRTEAALNKTVDLLPWLRVGDVYGVPNRHRTAQGALMAFPSYGNDYGCYVFDASVVFPPGLITHMGPVDWFPYAEEPTPLDIGPVPDLLGIPPVISSLGLWSFGSYWKMFPLVTPDMKDPILLYRDIIPADRLLATKIDPSQFHRVKTLSQISEFESKIVG